MTLNDVEKIIATAPAAELATYNCEGFPEIRALLNLANLTKYPLLDGKAMKFDGENLTLYFTTNTSSRKIQQIRKNNKVCLYFCLPKKFKGVSATGFIEEVTDLNIKKDFWQKGWEIYYPKGWQDDDYTLLKFTSVHLHCWFNFALHDFGKSLKDSN